MEWFACQNTVTVSELFGFLDSCSNLRLSGLVIYYFTKRQANSNYEKIIHNLFSTKPSAAAAGASYWLVAFSECFSIYLVQ
jgi:hypothetical protein